MDSQASSQSSASTSARLIPRRYWVWGATAVFTLFILSIIFWANSADTSTGFLGRLYAFPAGDKVGHFVLMGILSFLVNLSLRGAYFRVGRREFLKGSFLVALGVTAEEISQQYFPSRTFSLLDLSVDYAGIFLFGRVAAYFFYSIWPKFRRSY